ncbi:MAG: CHASE2 domain-containing protein [Fibrobacter sp.]|nr:CHASE2 domain-containing protein [Fibrobacter sp.]
MQIKLSKKLKKLLIGFGLTSVLVFLILFLGNVQNPQLDGVRNGAESLEYLFYDMFFKVKTGKTHNLEETGDKNALNSHYDPNIFIVDIDEPSLAKLGNYNTWDRSIHADVVKNLSNGGASAIGFDILFKNADFGEQKTQQVTTMLNKLSPDTPWDSLGGDIRTFYNYDSMLVSAVKESGNTIVCNIFDSYQSYKHESQWRPLSTVERADEVGYSSTFELSQVDSAQNIEPKDLLDNIFPELAKAGAQMGSVNAYPDDDGVVRRVSLLYRFPNPELYSGTESKIYSTMPLMSLLHLFHQKPENVKIKMGQYIDLGKPFGIYKDSSGFFHTTFPQFSYPMFLALHKKIKEAAKKPEENTQFIDISSKIIATKNSEGNVTFEIFEGQMLNETLSDALSQIDVSMLDSLGEDEEKEVAENITVKRDEEGAGRFVLTDSEEDEEAVITPYIVNTVKYFADSLQRLPPNKPTHISMDMDIHYDIAKKKWVSNLVILNNDVLTDIINTSEERINNLGEGKEIRFGKVKQIPIDRWGHYQINYKGRYNTAETERVFQHLSYYDITKNRVDPGLFQGKIFILGSAAPALFDFVTAPHEENYPGVLTHATILQNILNDDFLVTLQERYQQIIVVLLALVCLLVGLYVKSYISIALSFVLMGGYLGIAYHYFEQGLYLGASKQIFAILFTNIIALIIQFYFETKEKRFLGNAFKQYISPELIDEMVNNEIMPTLGGSKSNITAYFTDIASFSTFSEKIGDPSKLVELLNEYLTAMTDTLLENKGTLDKYEGDAIIAFFGAPMPLPNHAQNACDSAVDMQTKLMALRKKWAGEGNKWPKVVHDMHMRIGINSGDIVTGNMGSTMRKNYTMMGDAVNLAARLESAAKQYGAYIQISEDTQKHLDEGRFIYRSLDTIRVIGKSQPVKTFELLAKPGCENEAQLHKLVEIWEQARTAYLAMDWDRAEKLFAECLDYEPHHPDRDPGSKTTPSHVYIKRCEAYKVKPPVAQGETWDGVFTATEK